MPLLIAHKGPPAWLEYVGQGALQDSTVARSAMLLDLCATSGHVMIPITDECFHLWLSAQDHNSCAHLTPSDMIGVLVVRGLAQMREVACLQAPPLMSCQGQLWLRCRARSQLQFCPHWAGGRQFSIWMPTSQRGVKAED